MNRQQHYAHFVAQKLLIEKRFPVFRCQLRRGVLECVGAIAPSPHSISYTIRIRHTEWGIPEVRVTSPVITPDPKIHMYGDGRLCLYHPPTQPWYSTAKLHETIIPWTADWLVYYELYQTEGKWLGIEAPHSCST